MTEQREQCCGTCKSWVWMAGTCGMCYQIRWHTEQGEWCEQFAEAQRDQGDHDEEEVDHGP
jgi:hypothetical protein